MKLFIYIHFGFGSLLFPIMYPGFVNAAKKYNEIVIIVTNGYIILNRFILFVIFVLLFYPESSLREM